MVENRSLVWDKEALKDFKIIYSFLKTGDNLAYANEVKKAILKIAKELVKNPFIFSKIDLSLITMEVLRLLRNLSIVYKITEDQVRILRVRHTSREPIGY